MRHQFFLKALKGNNNWWLYLLGILVVIVGYFIGQIPLMGVLQQKMSGMDDLQEANSRLMEYDFAYFGLDQNFTLVLILLSFVAAFFILWFWMDYVHRRPFRSLITPLAKLNWSKIAFGFAAWFGLTLVIELIGLFIDPDNYILTFNWRTFLPLLAICLIILPIQTSFEELFMRGYLMQGLTIHPGTILCTLIFIGGIGSVLASIDSSNLENIDFALLSKNLSYYTYATLGIAFFFLLERYTNIKLGLYRIMRTPILPLIITSAIFGLMHGMNPEIEKFGFWNMMSVYIGMGFMLGLITLLDESLELALGVHFANNLFAALFVSFEGSALQTPAVFRAVEMNTDYMFLGFMIMASIFMAIVYYKYRWKDFGKLFSVIAYNTEGTGIKEVYSYKNEHINTLDENTF